MHQALQLSECRGFGLRADRGHGETAVFPHLGPAALVGVQVRELELLAHEPTLEIQALVGLAQALRETSEIQPQDALERREDLLPRPLLELEAAAGGEVRKGAVTQC